MCHRRQSDIIVFRFTYLLESEHGIEHGILLVVFLAVSAYRPFAESSAWRNTYAHYFQYNLISGDRIMEPSFIDNTLHVY